MSSPWETSDLIKVLEKRPVTLEPLAPHPGTTPKNFGRIGRRPSSPGRDPPWASDQTYKATRSVQNAE